MDSDDEDYGEEELVEPTESGICEGCLTCVTTNRCALCQKTFICCKSCQTLADERGHLQVCLFHQRVSISQPLGYGTKASISLDNCVPQALSGPTQSMMDMNRCITQAIWWSMQRHTISPTSPKFTKSSMVAVCLCEIADTHSMAVSTLRLTMRCMESTFSGATASALSLADRLSVSQMVAGNTGTEFENDNSCGFHIIALGQIVELPQTQQAVFHFEVVMIGEATDIDSKSLTCKRNPNNMRHSPLCAFQARSEPSTAGMQQYTLNLKNVTDTLDIARRILPEHLHLLSGFPKVA